MVLRNQLYNGTYNPLVCPKMVRSTVLSSDSYKWLISSMNLQELRLNHPQLRCSAEVGDPAACLWP